MNKDERPTLAETADLRVMVAEKAAEDLAELSIQERTTPRPTGGATTMWFVRRADEGDIAPWWSKQRDSDLRIFWRQPGNDILQGAVSSMVKKFKSMNWVIEAPERVAKRCQDVLANSEFEKGWGELLSPTVEDYLCLYGPSKVSLGGDRRGKTKAIRYIVRDKDPGPVISFDPETHRFTEREITSWEKTPLGNRRWWWISLESSGHGGNKRGGLYLTEDHPVLTNRGWLPACEVVPGMLVATGDPSPSYQQEEMLVGTILGDGCIGFAGKRSRIRFTHCKKQKPWLEQKKSALAEFGWTPIQRNISDEGHETLSANSHVSAALNGLRETFYPKGKKVVPKGVIAEYFGPRMMATWYCDDGSIHHPKTKAGVPTRQTASLCTHGFTKMDTEWLCGFLTAKGFPCRVQKVNGKKKAYHYLRFNVDGAEALFKYIAPFVPPFMRYKLPSDSPEFEPELWDLGIAHPHLSAVVESRERDPAAKYGGCKTTYHIGVDGTRNFIAAGMVVHNTQDQGAHIEVLGKGDPLGPIEGPVLGLAHMDAGRCTLTGDLTYPVLFSNTKTGKPHRMHASRVIHLVDMPSPNEAMNGIGFSSVSRVIASSQVLLKLARYKNEKLSDLPEAGLLILNNIVPTQWEDARAQHQKEKRRLGHEIWSNVMTLFSVDPAQAASAELVSFANLPDAFDERSTTETYINIVALAFGVDVREFWPMSAGPLGTAQETQIQHQKAKGKGIGDLITAIERAINWKVLPESATFRFDFTDDEEDLSKAQIDDARTQTIMSMWKPDPTTGSPVTQAEIRQMLADNVTYFPEEFLDTDVTDEEQATDIDQKMLAEYGPIVEICAKGKVRKLANIANLEGP